MMRSLPESSTGVEHSFNHKDKDKEEDKDNIKDSFDEFWEIYPRKAGKQEARKVFQRALSNASLSEILEGARRYASDPNRELQYTAHPATWLNQGRWSERADMGVSLLLIFEGNTHPITLLTREVHFVRKSKKRSMRLGITPPD